MVFRKTLSVISTLCLLAAIVKGRATNTLSVTETVVASDAASGDYFGSCSALSGDYLVAGAQLDDDNGSNSGAVYFFLFSSGAYVQKSKHAGASGKQIGYSCTLDGNFAAAGTAAQDDVHIYQTGDSGESWTVAQSFSGTPGSGLGRSLSLSGNYLAVGAPYGEPSATTNSGGLYIYVTQDGWATLPSGILLEASDKEASSHFGYSVSIDGDLVVASALMSDSSGKLYVFKTTDGGASWVEQDILTEDVPTSGNYLGWSVSIDTASLRVAAGTVGKSGFNGAVNVFESIDGGATWSHTVELTTTNTASGKQFGRAVTTDNGRIASTVWSQPVSLLFETSDGGATWEEVDLLPTSGSELTSIALDGNTIVHGVTSGNGAVEVFTPTNLVTVGGGGDPVIVDLHGHRFMAGSKPNTEYLLWADPKGTESISFVTSEVDGLHDGFFIHAVRVVKQGCGEVLLTAHDTELATIVEYPKGKTSCAAQQVMAGDSGLHATSVADGTVVFVKPHKANGFSFLNVKFFDMTDSFKANCKGMLCDETHSDFELHE